MGAGKEKYCMGAGEGSQVMDIQISPLRPYLFISIMIMEDVV
jgi:hypothetical protein